MIFQKEIDKLKEQIYKEEDRIRDFKDVMIDRFEKGVINDKIKILQAKLQVYEELSKKVEAVIDDIDLELAFTDIKDKRKVTIPESEELMKLFDIFWVYVQSRIKTKLAEELGGDWDEVK